MDIVIPYDTNYDVPPRKREYLALKGLNVFCDPVNTYYPGGNPLFDEKKGIVKKLDVYLKSKKIKLYGTCIENYKK